MAQLLTVTELTKRPGLSDVDPVQADAVLDDVSAMVRDIASPVLDAVDWPATPPGVVPVIVAMARRALVNPMGYIGAMAGAMSWQGAASDVYATEKERRTIRRAVGLTSAGTAQMEGWLPNQPSDYYPNQTGFDDTLTDLGL